MKATSLTVALAGTLLSGCGGSGSGLHPAKEDCAMSNCGVGTKGCGCSDDAGAAATAVARRALEVELLYLDLEVCDRCQDTHANLREAVRQAKAVLGPAGVDVTLKEIHVASEAQARALGFVSSPTIRAMGRDLAFHVKENACGSCSEIAGRDVSCRTWSWQGREHSAPPTAMLVDALLRDAYLHADGRREDPAPLDEVPENLKAFFRGARAR